LGFSVSLSSKCAGSIAREERLWDVCLASALGTSEVQQVQKMISGCLSLVEFEQMLEQNSSVELSTPLELNTSLEHDDCTGLEEPRSEDSTDIDEK